jgi:hypothetical protein
MYYLRNILILACGVTYLKSTSTAREKRDTIEKQAGKLYDVFFGISLPSPIFTRSEFIFDKVKVSKNKAICRSPTLIKFMEDIRKQFSTIYIALYNNQELVACTSAYNHLHETDK